MCSGRIRAVLPVILAVNLFTVQTFTAGVAVYVDVGDKALLKVKFFLAEWLEGGEGPEVVCGFGNALAGGQLAAGLLGEVVVVGKLEMMEKKAILCREFRIEGSKVRANKTINNELIMVNK